MAKAGHGYPQVMPRAADLMHTRVVTAPPRWSVDRVLGRARAVGAVVVAHAKAGARTADLERAATWGLGRWPWTAAASAGVAGGCPPAGGKTPRRGPPGGGAVGLWGGGGPGVRAPRTPPPPPR